MAASIIRPLRVPRHLVRRFGMVEIHRRPEDRRHQASPTSASDVSHQQPTEAFHFAGRTAPRHHALNIWRPLRATGSAEELQGELSLRPPALAPTTATLTVRLTPRPNTSTALGNMHWTYLRRNDFSAVSGAARAALTANRIELSDDDPLFSPLLASSTTSPSICCGTDPAPQRRQDRGDYATQPTDALFKMAGELVRAYSLRLPGASHRCAAAGPLFSEFRDRFLAEKERSMDWRPQVIKKTGLV